MSDLSKKLRELAEADLTEMVVELQSRASKAVGVSGIQPHDLLRIAAGGKTQVLRNAVIKCLVDAKAAELMRSIDLSTGQ